MLWAACVSGEIRERHLPLRHRLGRGGTEDFGGGDDGVGVDGDGVFDPDGVSAGESDHDGDVAGAGGAEDKFVALLQSFDGEVQPPS